MAIFSAYLPPAYQSTDPAKGFKLVSDAKAPLAFVFPPFWLAWHRLWLELLAYFAVAIAIASLAAWQTSTPLLYLSALPGLYLLLEGNELVRRKLERDGWRFAGIVDATNLEEAEIRFIVENEALLNAPVTPAHKPVSEAPIFHSKPLTAGLFPE